MTATPDASRSTPRVFVQFSHPDRRFAPSETLVVRYEIEGLGDEPPSAVEHSVLWYTEGKGEEDLGIHFFDRVTDPDRLPPLVASGDFTTTLPPSPLSYEGVIVKIRWCVRVRCFFAAARDFVSEHEFTIGHVPPARIPVASLP